MTSLVADDAMLAVLGQAKGLAEIRDSNGKVIGFFCSHSWRINSMLYTREKNPNVVGS